MSVVAHWRHSGGLSEYPLSTPLLKFKLGHYPPSVVSLIHSAAAYASKSGVMTFLPVESMSNVDIYFAGDCHVSSAAPSTQVSSSACATECDDLKICRTIS
jgi:hypothetical protein